MVYSVVQPRLESRMCDCRREQVNWSAQSSAKCKVSKSGWAEVDRFIEA